MNEINENLRTYELSFLLTGEEAGKDIAHTLLEKGMTIVYESVPQSIRLAYPIKKQTSAFFGFVQFTADPSVIPGLVDELNKKPAVLRVLLVTPPPRPPVRFGRPVARPTEMPSPATAPELTNEVLEQKLEEILK